MASVTPGRPQLPTPDVPIADANLALRAQQDWYDYLAGLAGAEAAAGGGNIAFPAVQVPSADVNTLDDYEEGSWTPTITFAVPSGLSVAYGDRNGQYVKIGKLVSLSFIVTAIITKGGSTGDLQVTGLPFTHEGAGSQQSGLAISWQGINKAGGYTQVGAAINSGTSLIYFPASGMGTSIDNVDAVDVTGGPFALAGLGHYRTST